MFKNKTKPDDRSAPRYKSLKPVFMGTFFNFKKDTEIEIAKVKMNISTIRRMALVLLLTNILIVIYLSTH